MNAEKKLSNRNQRRTSKARTATSLGAAVLALAIGANAPEAGAKASQPKRSTAATGPTVGLSEYLEQVSAKHLGYKASDQTARAAKLYSGEASTIYAPQLIANASQSSEGRSNPFDPGSHFSTKQYSLGVSQATSAGINGKLSYTYFDLSLPGVIDFDTGYAQIDVSASLLRNLGGSELKAQAAAAEAGALAKSFSQSYVTKSLLLEAEANYWRLALARDLVAVQRDAVDRAQKIYDWANRRVRLQLSDRSEILQATGNLQARRLELRAAEDEERAAALAFNSSRGLLGDQVSDRLIDLNPDLIARMTAPERTVKRDDLRAAEFQAKASAASAVLSREKSKPTLELFGSSPLTEPATPTGASAAFIPITARPLTTIGVRLSAPLNLGTLSDVREGYAAEARAADWQFQRTAFEEERD